MPFNLPKANAGADMPEIEDGLKPALFIDLIQKSHPDWATKEGETDRFGKVDDGERYHFVFVLVADDESVLYDGGDPLEVEAVTNTSTGEKSNFAKILSGILTKTELAAWQNDEPFDGEKLIRRPVTVNIAHGKDGKGWPKVDAVYARKVK